MKAANAIVREPFSTSIRRIREMRESSNWPSSVPEFVAEERASRVSAARHVVRPKLFRAAAGDIAPAKQPPVYCSRELVRPLAAPFVIVVAGALLVGIVWRLLEIKAVYDFTLRMFPP